MPIQSRIFCNAKISAGAAIEAITAAVPKGVLRRVEVYVVSDPTSYPDAATAVLDELYLQDLGDITNALHLLSQETLNGRGVVAWEGKFTTGHNNFALTAWFVSSTAGDKLEMNFQVDVET